MNADLIERLAEAVHIGWMQERQAQGCADHVFSPIDQAEHWLRCRAPHIGAYEDRCWLPPERHHPDMLPYADLAENIKEYDRATVRAVLRALDAAGLQIVQDTSRAAPR